MIIALLRDAVRFLGVRVSLPTGPNLRDAVLSSRTSTKKPRFLRRIASSRIFRGEGIATNRAQSEGRGPLFQNVIQETTSIRVPIVKPQAGFFGVSCKASRVHPCATFVDDGVFGAEPGFLQMGCEIARR
jgi:hypothetical protein